MDLARESIGLIAGNRSLPLTFARLARQQGVNRIIATAVEGETSPEIARLVDEVVWLKVGQLGKMIDTFTSRGIKECVMLGQVAPKNLFDVRPDFRAMALLFRLKEKNAHTIFGGIALELEKDGVRLIDPTPWLAPIMPASGFCLGRAPSKEQTEDVRFGLRIAKEVSRLEIGQTVVVKEGTILAVEGFEGTDRCLARGGELAGAKGGAVAVKVAKENHDMRFDVPCVGRKTIEVCAQSGIQVFAFEPGRTLLLEREEVEALLKEHRITLVAAS